MNYPIIVSLDNKYFNSADELYLNGKLVDESMGKSKRPYVEGTLVADENNTYFVPLRSNVNTLFAKAHPNAVVMLETDEKPKAGLDISKMLVVGNDTELKVRKNFINKEQYRMLIQKQDELWDKVEKYVKEYKREVRAGERLKPEYRYTSLQNFHEELGLEKMERQTERQLDLENLKNLQEEGKIDKDKNLDKIAAQLPSWRDSEDSQDKMELAKYGRDSDLDKLVNDDDINVVIAVADRGRDKDLDKLVSYEDEEVRAVVAEQGRDKDLDRLVDDTSTYVRERVATVGRDKDLDQLVGDPELGVRYYVAKQGRDKDLDILVNDEEEDVRAAVAEIGRDKDLGKLVNDKDPDVRKAAEDALEKNRGKSSDLEKRRRAAARKGMER